jgi:hypothetical protein
LKRIISTLWAYYNFAAYSVSWASLVQCKTS